MNFRNCVDPVRLGEEIVDEIFHHIFHDEGARKHFKFSQINCFNNKEGLPGWNVWLEDKPGAYQLKLAYAAELPIDTPFSLLAKGDKKPGETIVEGRFLIRYFPDQHDFLLDHFSWAETLIRLGDLFDNTGTPSLSGQEAIDDSYFVVGYLDFRTTTSRDFVELACIAPNRWKDVRIDGLYLNTPANEHCQLVRPGAVDRDVPGWDLAFYLFDKLITALGYVSKTSIYAAVLAQKKWVRFDIENNECREKDDLDIDLTNVTIGIKKESCCNDGQSQPFISPEKYSDKIKHRLIAEDFQILETAVDAREAVTLHLKTTWWSASDVEFPSEMESDMHHCCFHDH